MIELKGNLPVLIVLAGLPGTGKTTLAKMLSKELNLFFLRVDCIETPFMTQNEMCGSSGEGYQALVNLAEENLNLGHSVIIDCVNPIHDSRKMFLNLAQRTNAVLFQFELKTKDLNLHRKRIEKRKADIPNQKLPSWNDVLIHNYECWDEKKDEAVAIIWTDNICQAFDKCLDILRNNQ
ncbi:MAG: AAA family ATPase [Alphaproteobacteria bacterium]|nr:AAA family ATPase [Alphaproteobacteria bacterium]